MALIPSDIEKNKRSQYQKFLDITPSSTASWKVIGIGISEASVDYNPSVDTEQWIIEDSARNDHTGNQKQLSVTQRCYKNDPEFEFINAGRDKLNYVSHILEIDTWNGNNGSYPAKKSDCLVTVTSYSGEEIEYTIYFNGDPTEGTASIADGVPTFTPTTSL
ncbi:MAG: hypothetical protein IKN65_00825 [Clostridia bacterium]|nr:hypothetical protein [Bacilli bacterium]MBR3672827.1 hypothetical protein [Clostridia bacterium]